MPIYEEKLISPLALHFTQDHIRTTFRDHRSVDAAVDLIEVEASPCEEYDLILKAPFPNIEILRWRPKGPSSRSDSDASASSDDSESDEEERDEYWFTLDNRRLYCLQRKAAEYWPRRVAAVVEVLYFDMDSCRKKYDSKSNGWDVTIAHSVKAPQIAVWDWRKSVMAADAPKEWRRGVMACARSVQVDSDKHTVEELTDAPQQGGLMAMLAAEAQHRTQQASMRDRSGSSPEGLKATAPCDTPSTAHTDVSSDGSDAEVLSDSSETQLADIKRALAGVWVGSKQETYELKFDSEAYWQCVRTDATGRRVTFSMWYEGETGLVWWGNDWSFFLDVHEAVSAVSRSLVWYAAGDTAGRRSRFTWYPMEEEPEPRDFGVKAAIGEIQQLLWEAGGTTHQLWVPNWVQRYQGSLGSLRHFLESHPDEFVVTPGRGPRQYSVSAAREYPAWGYEAAVEAWWGGQAARQESKRAKARAPSGPIGTLRHAHWAPQHQVRASAPPGVWSR